MAVWFITPLFFLPIACILELRFFLPCNPNRGFNAPQCDFLREKYYLLPIYWVARVLIGYIVSVIWVYVLIPVSDIYWGFLNLCCHMKYKTDDSIYGDGTLRDDHERWPSYKLFEQFGEAIPQFVIGVTFYFNNHHWLLEREVIFGIVTMTLSLGSIVIGIVNGCIACTKLGLGL